ncbi:unnamed protein product [Cylicocyclus nassatus]|uniref:Uncharacterized protein n=1 Tax=Cylicocyclus nassatus TaxID=53992 RepID=A0AA36HBW6_CYLNA|nr:unnamed protein product [Cylicocyclus nassatus]
MKKNFDVLIEDIQRILGYDAHDDRHPMGWPRPCGIGSNTFAISVKATYAFWRWYTGIGKEVLKEYNKKHGTNILLLQEQTIRQTDLNRLCRRKSCYFLLVDYFWLLLLRLQIRQCYQAARKRGPEVRIRRNKVEIVGLGMYDPVILARRLNWKVPGWNGTPLSELLDMKLKKEEEEGKLVIGELLLPGLTIEEQKESVGDGSADMEVDASNKEISNKENYSDVVKKKRRSQEDSTIPKKYKKVALSNNSDRPSTSKSF